MGMQHQNTYSVAAGVLMLGMQFACAVGNYEIQQRSTQHFSVIQLILQSHILVSQIHTLQTNSIPTVLASERFARSFCMCSYGVVVVIQIRRSCTVAGYMWSDVVVFHKRVYALRAHSGA